MAETLGVVCPLRGHTTRPIEDCCGSSGNPGNTVWLGLGVDWIWRSQSSELGIKLGADGRTPRLIVAGGEWRVAGGGWRVAAQPSPRNRGPRLIRTKESEPKSQNKRVRTKEIEPVILKLLK